MYKQVVCATNSGRFGEIGAYFSLQLSLRTQFAKIENKKLSLIINVENIETRY